MVALDFYYDPTIDEHVTQGNVALIAPSWYLAPQKPHIAGAGWQALTQVTRLSSGEPIRGLDDPRKSVTLLQYCGEFGDPDLKDRVWRAAEKHIEPQLDAGSGEFTLGFGLNESFPRGQWNAQAMAGWVCTKNAWSKLFTQPNLKKFKEPTVEGVDFPDFALSEARWTGDSLRLRVHPKNSELHGKKTTMRITNLNSSKGWFLKSKTKAAISLKAEKNNVLTVELVADDQPVTIGQD